MLKSKLICSESFSVLEKYTDYSVPTHNEKAKNKYISQTYFLVPPYCNDRVHTSMILISCYFLSEWSVMFTVCMFIKEQVYFLKKQIYYTCNILDKMNSLLSLCCYWKRHTKLSGPINVSVIDQWINFSALALLIKSKQGISHRPQPFFLIKKSCPWLPF